jgi:NADH-quinone oxidoreductase subunit E
MDEIKNILQNYQNRDREYLLPILQDIQHEKGYLSNDAIVMVAEHLKIPTSKVYAVATFYDRFRFSPKAKYRIKVCNGTGCHIKGSGMLFKEFEKIVGTNGANFKSEMFSTEEVACLGACGNAPVVKINDVFYTNVETGMISAIIAAIKSKEGI